jgi:hypothetical protein
MPGSRWPVAVSDDDFVLPRPLPVNERIYKAGPLTKRLFGNWYKVRSDRDLDQEFADWLREARDIGDGVHLAREAASGRPDRPGPD